MIEAQVLRLMETRDGFNRYYHMVEPKHLGYEGRALFVELPLYYQNLSVGTVDWMEYSTWYKITRAPAGKPLEVHERICKLAAGECANDPSVLSSLSLRAFATELADTALRLSENDPTASVEEIMRLVSSYETRRAENSSICLESDMDDLVETLNPQGGLSWRLRELNLSAGPIRQGDLMCLGARPEAGKTSFLASEVTWMASQLPKDKFVVWFNNEESGNRVKLRLVQAALGWKREQILVDPARAKEKYIQMVGDWNRIVIIDSADITIRKVESAVRQYPPGLIVFDQLRKVRAFGKAERSDVQRLALLYGYARSLAKRYAPVLTVHQAGGDAANSLYPEAHMLEGCRTEIQGELDLQIMMGRTEEVGKEMARGLHLVKNKLPSPGDEALRHSKWLVYINSEIARFESGY